MTPVGDRTSTATARQVRETTPFVAREAEYAWLERCLQDVVAGRPRVCLVSGDPGIGKSRLVRELAAAARRAELRVCYGRGYQDYPVPYAPFEPLIDELATSAGEDPRTRIAVDTLCSLRGLDADRASAEPGEAASLSAEAERRRSFHDVARGIFPHAQRGALLLVLEDIHWFDSSSLDLLSHVAFAAADASVSQALPLMLVCTYRPPETETALARFDARFRREDICEQLELQGLESEELAEMIRGLGGAMPPNHVVTRILEVTHGNPLFTEEIFHQFLREGTSLASGSDGTAAVDVTQVALPTVLSDAISARVQKLSIDCRTALTLAAFMPEPFRARDVADAGEMTATRLDEWLEEARKARLLSARGDTLRFAHPLMRQVFQQLPAPAAQRATRRRLALWLEKTHAGNLEPILQSLADHWSHGREPGDETHVLEVLRRAGDQAFRVFDWPGATRCYEAALEIAGAGDRVSTRVRGELHYAAAVAQFREMDADAALAHYASAAALFAECGETTGLTRVLLEQARTQLTLRSGAYGTLIDVAPLEASLAALGEAEPALQGYVCATLGEAYAIGKDWEHAADYGQRAVALAETLKDERLAAYANCSLGVYCQQTLDLEAALAQYETALECSRRSGEAWTEGWALERMPLTLAWLGRLDAALARTGDAAKIAQQINDWGDYSLATGAHTALATARGDFAGAEAHARETLSLVRRTGYPWGGAVAITSLAGARALQGEWEAADDALSILATPGAVFQDVGPEMEFLAGVGRMRLRALAGNVDAATHDQATNLLPLILATDIDVGTLGAFCAFVEIGECAGDPRLAEQSYARLEVAVERGVAFTAGCEFLVLRVLGIAAAQIGRESEAETHLRAAIALARRVGARPELARSCVSLSELLLKREPDRPGEAVRLLEHAEDIFHDRGMLPLLARSMAVRREHGLPDLDLGDLPSARPDELSVRETEVLRAVARGLDDEAIGEALLLLPETVRTIRRSIFEKIGVDGRTGATAYAYAHAGGEGAQNYLPQQPRGGGGRQVLWVSDIVQSTELLDTLGDARAHELFRLHNRVVRARLRAHRGEEVQHTGDGLIAAFPRGEAAIRCAVAVQREIHAYNQQNPDTAFSVRIGVHAGRPLADEGRLFGVAVHTAFRVCDRAAGNEIIVSQEIVEDNRDTEFQLEDLGAATLRGLSEALRLYRVKWSAEVTG